MKIIIRIPLFEIFNRMSYNEQQQQQQQQQQQTKEISHIIGHNISRRGFQKQQFSYDFDEIWGCQLTP
jgi:hypothetical protein